MSQFLVIHVSLLDGRYHGAGDWPPAPARLFQAIIAGIGLGGPLPDAAITALRWLEEMPAPIITAPQQRTTAGYTNFVPNNDLDTKQGDPRQIGSIRAGKTILARLFDPTEPIRYTWEIAEPAHPSASLVVQLVEQLYQFGRGVDLAWAWGEIMDDSRCIELMENSTSVIYRPSAGSQGLVLQVPTRGSFDSLERRYQAGSRRFTTLQRGRSYSQSFAQPPKPRFASVSYNSPRNLHLFDLKQDSIKSPFYASELAKAASLTTEIRDAVAERLRLALPAKTAEIDRCMLGKNSDDSHHDTSKERVVIVPLSSIGHHHADMLIRRIAIEIAPNCPIAKADMLWAFSGLKILPTESSVVLFSAEDTEMLEHYGAGKKASVWRTITPVALPANAARRRIDPDRESRIPKDASEKTREQAIAIAAVIQALRHAGIQRYGAVITRIQKEPFQSQGKKAQDFAPHTRFAKERLWHVEIEFPDEIEGPLFIGDGRFSGLGVFAPCPAAAL